MSSRNLCFTTCNGVHRNIMFLLKSELACYNLKRHLAGGAGILGIPCQLCVIDGPTLLIYNYSLRDFPHQRTGNHSRAGRLCTSGSSVVPSRHTQPLVSGMLPGKGTALMEFPTEKHTTLGYLHPKMLQFRKLIRKTN